MEILLNKVCVNFLFLLSIFSVPHAVIICDWRVKKVMFSSVQFNMDEVDPLIIHDCIKTYPMGIILGHPKPKKMLIFRFVGIFEYIILLMLILILDMCQNS